MSPAPLLTRPFVLASFANLFQGLSFFLFIHLPGYLADLGANEVEIGLIIGVTAVASIAVRPAIGRTMDTRGRRPVVVFGGALNLVAVTLYLTVGALNPWLYAVRIVHGVAEATLFTALFTYGADVVPASRRTEGLALFGVSGLLPIALGGLVGDLVLGWRGFDELFVTASAFAALALATGWFLPEMAPSREEAAPRAGFLAAIRQTDLRPLWWMTGIFSLVLTGYFTFLRTFVDETGIGTVGMFFAAYSGTAVLLRLAFAWVPDRIGPKRALYPAFVSLAIGFVLLARAQTGIDVAAAGVLCGIGHGYAFPILFGFTVTRASVEDRGSALAFFTALFDIGLLAGGPLLGGLIAGFGYSVMFAIAAALLLVGVLVFAVWDRRFDQAVTVTAGTHR